MQCNVCHGKALDCPEVLHLGLYIALKQQVVLDGAVSSKLIGIYSALGTMSLDVGTGLRLDGGRGLVKSLL